MDFEAEFMSLWTAFSLEFIEFCGSIVSLRAYQNRKNTHRQKLWKKFESNPVFMRVE